LADWLAIVGFTEGQIPASLNGRVGLWRSWSAGKRVALVIDDAVTPEQVLPLARARTIGGCCSRSRPVDRLAGAGLGQARQDRSARRQPAKLLLSRMAGRDRISAEPDAVAELISPCHGSALVLSMVGAMLARTNDRRSRGWQLPANEEHVLRELSRDENQSLTVVFPMPRYSRLIPLGSRCYELLGAILEMVT